MYLIRVLQTKCFERLRDGNSNPLDVYSLKENVRGNSSETTMVDFYVMELPSDQSFSELFESKKIDLIDMPWLGGPYFKDTEKSLKYIENLDMSL